MSVGDSRIYEVIIDLEFSHEHRFILREYNGEPIEGYPRTRLFTYHPYEGALTTYPSHYELGDTVEVKEDEHGYSKVFKVNLYRNIDYGDDT